MRSKEKSVRRYKIRVVIMSFISCCILIFVLGPAQDAVSSKENITKDIIARYRSFEGPSEEQTWEKWQSYFLNSPNIGNIHGDQLEIGWEVYQKGSQDYYKQPVAQKAGIRFDNLRVFIVDEKTAWVTGTFVNIIGEKEIRPIFYDMLTKTPEGWRVFFSYVAPPK